MGNLVKKRSDLILHIISKIFTILLIVFFLVCFIQLISKGYKTFFDYYLSPTIAKKYEYLIEDNNKLKSKYNLALKYHNDPRFWNNLSIKEKKNLEQIISSSKIIKKLNYNFFTYGNSNNYNKAGIGVAIIGTLTSISIALLSSFFIALIVSIYLVQWLKNKTIKNFIMIFINGLNGMPSIIYGILSLSIFINQLSIQRFSILIVSLTLVIFILPFLISLITQALEQIPFSIKEATIALGANKMQLLFNTILPLAKQNLINIMLLALLRMISETAPLIMVGSMAFIANIPSNINEPVTTLPMQIYLWFNSPIIGFEEKSAATILILLLIISFFCYISNNIKSKYNYTTR